MLVFLTIMMMAGLALSAAGAGVAASGVTLTDEQTDAIAGTYWDTNQALKAALKEQSATARKGLKWVVFGTMIQIVATGGLATIEIWK